MDDQKNKPGQNFGDNHGDKRQESPESGSSYYYSYGPFQSYGKNNEGSGEDRFYERRQPEEVEITRPEPVKPLPMHDYRSSAQAFGGSNGDGGRGVPTLKSAGNWQYSKPPKKQSFRSVIAGVLAGMLIVTGAMVFADRENLFTSNQAAATTTAPASGTTTEGSGNGSAGKAANVVYPVTSSGDVTSVVNQAGPAVVKIETLTDSSKQSSNSNPYSNDPFYRYFFGDSFGSGRGNSSNGGSSSGAGQLVPTGIGSGFIFDKTGYILTNEHVIHGADVVQVTVQGTDKPYEAKVLGSSYDLDLAVLKIDGSSNFPSIPLGDSNSTQVGEWLVAIGNPQGFDHTVTAGVLSAKERGPITIPGENGEKDREYEHLLQTDASINPGNSGGPLLNLNGEVIGINVAVSTDSQGIGFAIPSSTIKEVLDKLKNNEEIPAKPEPFIGATLMTMTDEVAKQMGTDVKEGSIVTDVVFKSPAYTADLRPYDIIVGANGTKFATKEKLIEFIQKQKVGAKVTMNVVRDGKNVDLQVTIGDKNNYPNVE
ncbi:PDZ domain-containing protein [Paenibacillus macerans]|uniref:PDZ domain-containing protein n=1 Tax=Paenibacillus macerans TaxID=44252 RepID=A0A6N8F5J6_PAEMA|nr:trypsin-like peptidase domain-containing protein [Paenibacillus macerans]MUG25921.1 PDZ domain-containing protein [Paenibacillus macerans]UMV50426.1 trypsin-like peptidase domain-containing protein [Paenibacillus macerans]